VANYGLVTALTSRRDQAPSFQRFVLALGIAGNLAVLGYFKYKNFFVENVSELLGFDSSISTVVLPLGISFFTFQKIALLVDAYQGKIRQVDFLEYALFVAFFPQLIAGPIVHHSEVMPQFRNSARVGAEEVALGLTIFIIGLGKKV